MDTIVINLDDADEKLVAAIRRVRESGGHALLMDANVAVAEIRPLPALVAPVAGEECAGETTETEDRNAGWIGPRLVVSEITGMVVVAARPGRRKVTNEQIYEWLRGSFP